MRLFRRNRGDDDGESKATKANLGNTQSAMYYDTEKKRWRERGKENEETEEVAPPPPPMATEPKKEEAPKDGPPKASDEPPKSKSAADALCAPPNPYAGRLGKRPGAAAPAAGGADGGPPMFGGPFGAMAQPSAEKAGEDEDAGPAPSSNPFAKPAGKGLAQPMNPYAPRGPLGKRPAAPARGPFGRPQPGAAAAEDEDASAAPAPSSNPFAPATGSSQPINPFAPRGQQLPAGKRPAAPVRGPFGQPMPPAPTAADEDEPPQEEVPAEEAEAKDNGEAPAAVEETKPEELPEVHDAVEAEVTEAASAVEEPPQMEEVPPAPTEVLEGEKQEEIPDMQDAVEAEVGEAESVAENPPVEEPSVRMEDAAPELLESQVEVVPPEPAAIEEAEAPAEEEKQEVPGWPEADLTEALEAESTVADNPPVEEPVQVTEVEDVPPAPAVIEAEVEAEQEVSEWADADLAEALEAEVPEVQAAAEEEVVEAEQEVPEAQEPVEAEVLEAESMVADTTPVEEPVQMEDAPPTTTEAEADKVEQEVPEVEAAVEAEVVEAESVVPPAPAVIAAEVEEEPLESRSLSLDDAAECCRVCRRIEELTLTDVQQRAAFVAKGGIAEVMRALQHYGLGIDVEPLQSAIDVLWNLTFEEAAKIKVSEAEGIPVLIQAMKNFDQSSDIQGSCCAVLMNLAAHEPTRWRIIRSGGVEAIVTAMQRFPANEEVQEQGCQALYMLALHKDCRPLVLAGKAEPVAQSAVGHTRWGQLLQEILAC